MSPPYHVLVTHLGTTEEAPVVRQKHWVESRYAMVPRRCPDCLGTVDIVASPPDGFDSALILIHDAGCPALHGVTGRREAPP